jgi:hypothetical protein
MIYIASIVTSSYDVVDPVCFERHSDSSIDNTEAALLGFFISPKLSIEYEEKPESARIFCPVQRYILHDGSSFERKYLRILVKNTGYVSANNCEAKMRMLSNNDIKQLVWEGTSSSTVLEGISLQKNIRARKGEELVHIVFSDSRFTNMADENKRVYAWVPTMRTIPPQNILEDTVLNLTDYLNSSSRVFVLKLTLL